MEIVNKNVAEGAVFGRLDFRNKDYREGDDGYIPASIVCTLSDGTTASGLVALAVGTDANGNPINRGWFDETGHLHISGGLTCRSLNIQSLSVSGNIDCDDLTCGDVSSSGDINTSGNITAQTMRASEVRTSGDITSESGDLTIHNGKIEGSGGIRVGDTGDTGVPDHGVVTGRVGSAADAVHSMMSQAGHVWSYGVDNNVGGIFKIVPASGANPLASFNDFTLVSGVGAGFGTASPSGRVQVDDGIGIMSSGLMVGSEGHEINNMVVLTGTTANAANTALSYPTAYTNTNTIVVCYQIERSAGNWANQSDLDGDGTMFVYLQAAQILIYHNHANLKVKSYRLTLMRYKP